MLNLEKYISLVAELNEQNYEDVGDFGSPFVFETDSFENGITFKGSVVFWSGEFSWIYDDEPNFIPFKDKVIKEIKNNLMISLKQIESFLERNTNV